MILDLFAVNKYIVKITLHTITVTWYFAHNCNFLTLWSANTVCLIKVRSWSVRPLFAMIEWYAKVTLYTIIVIGNWGSNKTICSTRFLVWINVSKCYGIQFLTLPHNDHMNDWCNSIYNYKSSKLGTHIWKYQVFNRIFCMSNLGWTTNINMISTTFTSKVEIRRWGMKSNWWLDYRDLSVQGMYVVIT